MKDIKIFILLWVGCILGSWALIPYILSLQITPPSITFGTLFFSITIQAVLIYALILLLCALILPKTDLNPFSISDVKTQILIPGITFGLLVGSVVLILNKTLFASSLLVIGESPPAWQGALGGIYGGINEEVLLRLFFFTLVYFLLGKLVGFLNLKRSVLLWVANFIAAIVFGLAHLPAAMKLIPLNWMEISRILLLNGIPGLLFGWLYWSRGFWTAALAHLVGDLVLHTFFR